MGADEVGAGHGHRLRHHGHSPVHRAPAHLKILALVGFMLVVVATPREWYPAYAGYLAVLLGVIALSRVPAGHLGRRMVVEVPFVLFAALMLFVATGPRVEILGVAVSEAGLLGAWGLLAKGTLGVLAALTLAATTEPHDLLRGLERLRMPQLIVQIMGFMVRYLDVVTGEMGRMATAMRSRGCDPRSPRHWPALARSLGALFVRSYERGERVHLAMLSRGYDGSLPR
jgi:cobalt/nickel transport system permease protein